MLKDHKIKVINISGSIHKKVLIASKFCKAYEESNRIFLYIKEPHEILVPMNQKPSQSEIPTSGYSQNIGRAFWNFLDSTQCWIEMGITLSFELL